MPQRQQSTEKIAKNKHTTYHSSNPRQLAFHLNSTCSRLKHYRTNTMMYNDNGITLLNHTQPGVHIVCCVW